MKTPLPSRNYAAVTPGDHEYAELKRLGMVKESRQASFSDYIFYACTENGRRVAMESYKAIQASVPKRRYRTFLMVRESYPGLTFQAFLTDPFFLKVRSNV